MAIGMRAYKKYWLSFLTIHICLFFLPSSIFGVKATAAIPYYSIWGVLELGSIFGLPVIGKVTEDMFIAPITFIGWSFVVSFWLLFYLLISQVISHLTSK